MNPYDVEQRTVSIAIFFQLQEEERYRLARSLMAGPGQILANTLIELDHSLPLIRSDPAAVVAGLSALREEIRGGLAQLKGFVADLQPPLLADLGLGPSLRQYLAGFGREHRLEVECIGCEEFGDRLPSTIETAVFRIVQEALANVLAHSGANRVRLEMSRVQDQIRLVVQDNGRGFNALEEATPQHRQLGLVGMFDRARLVGGQLQIFSGEGKGVQVLVTVPYHGHGEIRDSSASPGGQNENIRQNQNGRKKTGAVRQDLKSSAQTHDSASA